MDIDRLTSIDQLSGEQRELAELVGLEAYKKLVLNYAGNTIYIYKLDSVLKGVRDAEICEKFDGGNYRELAIEYDLASDTIRNIVAEKRRMMRHEPLEGQLSFEISTDKQENSE